MAISNRGCLSVVSLFLLCLAARCSTSGIGGNTLVLLDNLAIKESHSIFFKSLQGKFCSCNPTFFVLKFLFIFHFYEQLLSALIAQIGVP